MQAIESLDIFAKPVGNFLTLKHERKVSTLAGVVCSFVFYILVALAFGFLIAGMAGSDNYYQQSVAWVNEPVQTTPTVVTPDQIIIAFTPSIAETYMYAAIFQAQKGSNLLTPVTTALCNTVYAGNDDIISLIDDPKAQCIDVNLINQVQNYTFGQVGFANNLFTLRVSTCNSIIGNWYQNTHIQPPNITCTNITEVPANAPNVRVKILAKQFDQTVYQNVGDDETDMEWYLLADQTQGWLNNTQIVETFIFDRVQTRVGDNAFLNSEFFDFSSRTQLNYIELSNSNVGFEMYNYDIDSPTPMGSKPILLSYLFRLSPTLITNTVDLRRGFCESFAVFGGFLICMYFICYAFVYGCVRFEGEKIITDQLYVYNSGNSSSGDSRVDVKAAINSQTKNDMNAIEWMFCCCCGKDDRRKTFDETQTKMKGETDLVEIVQALRMVKFMRQLNDDKAEMSSLVKYDKQYRIRVPAEIDFPAKSTHSIQRDKRLVDKLMGESRVEQTLMANIIGEPVQADSFGGAQVEDIQAEIEQPLL